MQLRAVRKSGRLCLRVRMGAIALGVLTIIPGITPAQTGGPTSPTVQSHDPNPKYLSPVSTEVAPTEPTEAEIDTVIEGLRAERAD